MLRRLIVFGSISFAVCKLTWAVDDSVFWDVQPSECVVSESHEYCDTTLLITLSDTSIINPCVYVDNQWIGCFNENKGVLRFPIIIDGNITVRLENSSKKTLARRTIDYRLIQSTPKRRRIRLPWSVF